MENKIEIYNSLVNKEAKLAVIGLGYVGLPIALEFARKISVIGLGKLGFPMALFLRSKFDINAYDSNKDLRNLIKKNPSLHLPKENNIQKYLKKKLNVLETMHETLAGTNICYITVPTPSMNNLGNQKFFDKPGFCITDPLVIEKRQRPVGPFS